MRCLLFITTWWFNETVHSKADSFCFKRFQSTEEIKEAIDIPRAYLISFEEHLKLLSSPVFFFYLESKHHLFIY